MWLIDTYSYILEEVWDENAKAYAILSHRWEDEEVSFQDMQNLGGASKKKGFLKIKNACKKAVSHGFNHIWVDTCCINKDSSAELSEAINSMYRWYEASAICYAFLSDVDTSAQMESSMWFTRGWTLQELIAPRKVIFYNHEWNRLGTKESLSKDLPRWTGIDGGVLSGQPLSYYSIAQRMSWASRRVTTRFEDQAYCLLGIFGVNMPMVYGEREKAFLRLQEEIIKHSDDHTIFAWNVYRDNQPGLLAETPKAFEHCQHTIAITPREGHSSYSLTNRGLSIKLVAVQFTIDIYLARLDCVNQIPGESFDQEYHMGIFLKKLYEDNQYARVQNEGKTFLTRPASDWGWDFPRPPGTRPFRQFDFSVPQQVTNMNKLYSTNHVNGFRITSSDILHEESFSGPLSIIHTFKWDSVDRIMFMKALDLQCSLQLKRQKGEIKEIKLGFDPDFNLVCLIATWSPLLLVQRIFFGGLELLDLRREPEQFPATLHQDPFDLEIWSIMHTRGQELEQEELEMEMELRQKPGLWAVKGDRQKGLDLRIGGFAHLFIVRNECKDNLVWTVYLHKLTKQCSELYQNCV